MQKILTLITIVVLSLWLMLYGVSPHVVQAAPIAIIISPVTGPVGSGVTITAVNSSFTANETVTITYDGTQVLSTSANATGGLTAVITIPDSAGGSRIITATGAISANSGNITFTVTPSISANRGSATKGTSVTVAGKGFGASETGIAVTFDGLSVTSGISADSRGSWSASIVIPDAASGSAHYIDASGAITPATSVPELSFGVTPNISANKANAAPGTSITITGTGFGASETGITITYDGTILASGISANPRGGWSTSFAVPASPASSHTIDAYGSYTPAASVPDITFATSAGISANRPSAPPGSSITITGAGFEVGETGIAVTYDGTALVSGITANAQGGWTATFVVPASPSGSHTIDAYGSSTLATTVPDLTFAVAPGISINRPNAAPGSSITITGAGFGAGETGITIAYDGTAIASGITADPTGRWKANFTVPASPAGSHIIDAYGSVSQATAVSDVTFTVTPSISTNQPNAAPGSSITITGAGFGASETGISVTYDDKTVASAISANSLGGWSVTVIVPASASGTHSIKAQGSVTQLTSLSEAGFSIGAGIMISPASGYVGATVDITGSGFASRSPLRFTYDNKEIPADGLTTDQSGSFSKSITIPQSRAGNHTIKVVDGQSNESSVTFIMENTPPQAPALLSPGDGDRLGIVGNITPTLKWSSVTDPSGVAFILQMDTDPDFSHPILEKTAISGSRYVLSKAEALARGEYYWRIKAVDGASNESAWSQTWLLKSGLMPLSALIIILVLIAALVAALLYFLLARRLRRYEGVPVPEAEAPRVVPGQWRLVEPGEGAGERTLPWRLALPQPAKGEKVLSTEEMARLKVIMDFAQSLPLVEPGYTSKWLLDLAQNVGIEPSVEAYQQLLEGKFQVKYEPAWLHHPIFQDLAALLEGQPILDDLNAFVSAVNRCADEATLLLQKIYGEAVAEFPSGILEKDGWGFISAVYLDAMRWFLGKSLREPVEREYVIKAGGGADEDVGALYLWGEESTAFAEPLIRVADEKEAAQLRLLHLKLRRTYRNSEVTRQLVDMMTQLAVQRDRLSGAFGQFDSFTR